MMYRYYLILVVLVVLEIPSEAKVQRKNTIEHDFEIWEKSFEKSYSTSEEIIRKMIWESNMKKIIEHNKLYENGVYSYALGLNQFSDLTVEEYNEYNRLQQQEQKIQNIDYSWGLKVNNDELPDSVDWRLHHAVTLVKNQRQCGSCWAFSSTGALEGQLKIKLGILLSLSEQQLLDCCSNYTGGCNGGWMDAAFDCIRDNKGIEGEEKYPYKAEVEPCKLNPTYIVGTDFGFVDIPPGNETYLKWAVATIGPIAVAIDASRPSFQSYYTGIYDEPLCSNTTTNHAVLVVGYGTIDNIDYWLVKNSWGWTWGDYGYIKMIRNKYNQCAISSFASYPIVNP